MNLSENVRIALQSIWKHKLRSGLSMIGIIIGVAAVILIAAIGQGGTTQLTEAFAGANNTVHITPKKEQNLLPTLTKKIAFLPKDIQDLRLLPGVKNVIAVSYETANLNYQHQTAKNIVVYGVNHSVFFQTSRQKIAHGRFFAPQDYQSSNGGIILSEKAAQQLFGNSDPLGQIVRVQSQPVRVIGTLAQPEGLQGLANSANVFLPLQTWNRVFGQPQIDQLTLQVQSLNQIKPVSKQAIAKLNQNHGTKDEYEVQNLEQLTAGIEKIVNIMTIVISCIGGISLLVGGIGVMNIMLVSVTERTREIGIRIALGATRRHILQQFLIESMTISTIGGAIGILIGTGLSTLLQTLHIWPASVSMPVAIGGVIFSILLGAIFGILPANKAARFHPIDCLRYE
jgi:putative ABC transport system permease protein